MKIDRYFNSEDPKQKTKLPEDGIVNMPFGIAAVK